MAKQNRNTLKSYFETGDIPTEGQYGDLIDSFAILDSDNTGSLNILGKITATQFEGDGSLITGITASQINISTTNLSYSSGSLLVSGNLYYASGSTDVLLGIRTTGSILPGDNNLWDIGSPTNSFKEFFIDNINTRNINGATIDLTSHITTSGDISASGDILADNYLVDGQIALSTDDATLTGHLFVNNNTTQIEIGKSNVNTSTVIEGNITASNHISASGNIFANTFTGIFNGALSSSNQIASNISGAFTSTSASISTRLETAESELGNTLISSSNQIAADISGSWQSNYFNTLSRPTISGSWQSQYFNTLSAATISGSFTSQGFANLSAASISGSFLLNTTDTLDGSLNVTQNITASNISASGNLIANKLIMDGGGTTTPSITFRGDSDTGILSPSANAIIINAGGSTGEIAIQDSKVTIQSPTQGGVSLDIRGHITASGNISASGDITGNRVRTNGYYLGGADGDKYLAREQNGIATIAITDGGITNLLLGTPVTASGDISASGTITANTFTGIFNGALSSSNQIASNISGAFTLTSASLSSSVATNLSNINTNTSNISTLNSSGLLSGSTQIALNISGAFTNTSASLSSSVATNLNSINTLNSAGLLSSSNQIASNISGAFIGTSASIASDVATNSNNITTNVLAIEILNSSGLLSGSAQIASNISGAFTNTSASIALDIVNNAANTFKSTGQRNGDSGITGSLHLTGSTDVPATLKIDGTVGIGVAAPTTNNVMMHIKSNLTASSAQSPTIIIEGGDGGDNASIQLKNGDINWELQTIGGGYSDSFLIRDTSTTNYPFAIDPSAAGTGTHPLLYLENNKVSILGHINANPDANLLVSGNLFISGPKGHITASGNISSSGTITANTFTGTFNGALSSSTQIAANISGAFTSVSASLASSSLANFLLDTTDTLTGDLTVTNDITSSKLLIQKTSGEGTPQAGTSDVAIFQNNTSGQDASIAIIAADEKKSQIHFGRYDDIDAGSIKYFHSSSTDLKNTLQFKIDGTSNVIGFAKDTGNRGMIGVGIAGRTPTDFFHAQGALSDGGLTISSSNSAKILLKGTNVRTTIDRSNTAKDNIIEFNTAEVTKWTLGNIKEENDNLYIYSGGSSVNKHVSFISSSSTIFHTDITASNVSASGNLITNQITAAVGTFGTSTTVINDNISSSGTLSSSGIFVAGNISAISMSGNGSGLTGVVGQPSEGTYSSSLQTLGNITASGNISGGVNSKITIGHTLTAHTGSFQYIKSTTGSFSHLIGGSPITFGGSDPLKIETDLNIGVASGGGDAKLLTANDVPIIEPIVNGTFTVGVQGSGRTQFGGAHEVELYSQGATKIYSTKSDNNQIGSYMLMGSGSLPGGNNVANTDTNTIRFGFSGSSHPGLGDFYGGTDSIVFNTPAGHITASGNISASGNLIVNQITASNIGGTNINFQGNTTFNNDINLGSLQILNSNDANLLSPNPTSFTIGQSDLSLTIDSNITASGNISGSATSTLSVGGAATFGTNTVVINGTAGHITASGNITASKVLANTLNTGQGDYELYNMNQNVTTTSEVLFSVVSASLDLVVNRNAIIGNQESDFHTFTGNITASNNISSSGNITAITASIQHLDGPEGGEISFFGGNPTLKGEDGAQITLSDEATISGGINTLRVGTIVNVNTTHVTASGNISASHASTASFGSMNLTNLPTNKPTITGSLWLSGSAGQGSKFLVVFTG